MSRTSGAAYVLTNGTYATANTTVASTQVTGDTTSRFSLAADGTISLGNGSGGVDFSVKRNGASTYLIGSALTQIGGRLQLDAFVTGLQIFAGTGAPANANGNNGDFYLRQDTPGVALQRIYQKSAGAWVGVV